MTIRVLQLINNFYCDKGLQKWENRNSPLGNYCVLGYFDALDVKLSTDLLKENDLSKEEKKEGKKKGEEEGEKEREKTWNILGALSATKHDDAVSRRNIVCVPRDETRDQQFWNEETEFPFCFISMLRINKEKYTALQMTTDMQDLEENDQNIVTYYTYNHSEVVIVKKAKSYKKGIKHVISLRDRFSAFKVYSIFAVKEQALASDEVIAGKIEDEQIDCRLRCVVKDYKEAETFWMALQGVLKSCGGGKFTVKRYDTLGSYDWMIEINDISICSMLFCYKMGNILTHSNEMFEKAFFNVETEILIP